MNRLDDNDQYKESIEHAMHLVGMSVSDLLMPDLRHYEICLETRTFMS